MQLYRKFGSIHKAKALQRAEKLVISGKLIAAIEQYCKIVDEDPLDITTTNILGDLYVRAGMIPEAIFCFSRVAENYAENSFDLKAIAMSKKILKLSPNHLDTLLRLAHLYLKNKAFNEARDTFLQAAETSNRCGNPGKALEIYEMVAELDPSNTFVLLKLGAIYAHKGLQESALEVFIKTGEEFISVGDSDAAINAYSKALSLKPHCRQALQGIAVIYRERNQPERIIKLLQNGLKNTSVDVELLDMLGSAYLSAGLLEEAEQTFQHLFSRNPDACYYLLEVGEAFLNRGETSRALKQLEGCVHTLIARREGAKAIAFLRHILKKEPRHLGALKILYQIYLRLNDNDKLPVTLNSIVKAALSAGVTQDAVEALKKLIFLEPDDTKYRQMLCDLEGSDYQEPKPVPNLTHAAFLVNDTWAKFDYGSLMTQMLKADTLIRSGKLQHAINVLKHILDLDPDNAEVRLKLKALYLRTGHLDLAASENLQLARIHQTTTWAFALARSRNRQRELLSVSLNQQPADESTSGLEANEWGFTFRSATDLYKPEPVSLLVPAIATLALDANDERRQAERLSMNLPLVVGANDGGWKELTETVNISETGLLFRVGHLVEKGTNLRVGLPMPMNLRLFKDEGKLYKVQAMVRHSVQLSNGKNLVGVEFINQIFSK